MNSVRGGRFTRHHRTMELLAQARPERLDPDPDHARQQAAIGVAVAEPVARPESREDQFRPYPRRRRSAPAMAGAGLALAAGVTALAVLAAAGGPAGTGAPKAAGPGHRPTPAAVPSARQILLTAAVSAARQPATGRYWRVSIVSGGTMPAGPNAHPYAVEQRWAPEVSWDARSPRERSWTFPATGYASVPATAGAVAAWRADGSPRLPSSGSAQQAWWQTGGAVGYFGNGNLTFAQFQRLPSSPAALAAAVRLAAEQQVSPSTPPGAKAWREADLPSLSEDMFGVYMQLLKWDPITPAVRAAVFRDLAGLPGVHSIGKVTDPLGRTGYGIALAPDQSSSGQGQQVTEEVFVIAPGSGLLLTDEFVAVAASPPVPAPASGAEPGLGACPKGSRILRAGGKVCEVRATKVMQTRSGIKIVNQGGSRGTLELIHLGPVAYLAPGHVVSYDAVVGAGWTDATPPLPPRAQQFSVARDSKG